MFVVFPCCDGTHVVEAAGLVHFGNGWRNLLHPVVSKLVGVLCYTCVVESADIPRSLPCIVLTHVLAISLAYLIAENMSKRTFSVLLGDDGAVITDWSGAKRGFLVQLTVVGEVSMNAESIFAG